MLINNLFFADLGVPEGWPTSGKDKIIQDRAREGRCKNELTTYFESDKPLISKDLKSKKKIEKHQNKQLPSLLHFFLQKCSVIQKKLLCGISLNHFLYLIQRIYSIQPAECWHKEV